MHVAGLVVELAPDINVSGPGAHCTAGHEATLDQLVRVVTHDFTVLARARLAFVSVHHEVLGAPVRAARDTER